LDVVVERKKPKTKMSYKRLTSTVLCDVWTYEV